MNSRQLFITDSDRIKELEKRVDTLELALREARSKAAPTDLIRIAKAAKSFKCSRQTIYNRINEGRLQQYKIPGRDGSFVSKAAMLVVFGEPKQVEQSENAKLKALAKVIQELIEG